jgi:UDP-N-acetylglucosamine 2-epimerase (non-hydrolysing)
MPEEINRILTDCISDYLFVTEKSGLENLKNEGIPQEKIFFTGNCMIDSLIDFLPKAQNSEIKQKLGINEKYILLTFHRPSNVDNREFYNGFQKLIQRYSNNFKFVFPIHPRTRKNLETFGINISNYPNLILTEPLGYIDFLRLIKDSFCVITDSGGIQEETTYLGIPCVTIRENTERPITVEVGTNYLAGTDFNNVFNIVDDIINNNAKKGKIPFLWDGKAGERVAKIIIEKFNNHNN